MIWGIRIDQLDDGALPLYERGHMPELHVWSVEEDGRTWECRAIRSRRILLPLNIDMPYTVLERALPGMLTSVSTFPENGVLVFPVRCCYDLEGVGRIIMAGLSFVPGEEFDATPLGDAQPEDLILQYCRGLNHTDTNGLHPAVRDPLLRGIERREAKDRALARSKQLLEDCLTPEQSRELATTDAFHVRVRDGRVFKIARKFSHNVWLIEDGKPVIEYCIVTDGFVPLYDNMLAQKLLLEAAPEDFFRIANFRRVG